MFIYGVEEEAQSLSSLLLRRCEQADEGIMCPPEAVKLPECTPFHRILFRSHDMGTTNLLTFSGAHTSVFVNASHSYKRLQHLSK